MICFIAKCMLVQRSNGNKCWKSLGNNKGTVKSLGVRPEEVEKYNNFSVKIRFALCKRHISGA